MRAGGQQHAVRELPVVPNSSAHMAARSTRLGASEAAATQGLDVHRTAGQVWASKCGLWAGAQDVALHQMIGHALERPIADRWAERNGAELRQGPIVAQVTGRLAASLDHVGTWKHAHVVADSKVRVMQVAADAHLFTADGFPEAIRWQLLQGAALYEQLTGHTVELGICIALLFERFGPQLRTYVVRRTPAVREEWNDQIEPALQDWWGWVDARVPPPSADVDDITMVAATARADDVVDLAPTDDDLILVEQLRAARVRVAECSAALNEAKKAERLVAGQVAQRLGPFGRWPELVEWTAARQRQQPAKTINYRPKLRMFTDAADAAGDDDAS